MTRSLRELYVLEIRKEVRVNKCNSRRCRCVAMNKSWIRIALGIALKRKIHIYTVGDWTLECTLHTTKGLQSLKWYNDDVLLLSFENGVVEMCEICNSVVKVIEPMGHDGNVITVNVSDDRMRVQSLSFGGPIFMWDYRDGSWVSEKLMIREEWYECAVMNGDGSRVIAGLKEGIVQIWLARQVSE